MTCVVGMADKGKVYIGTDSLGICGSEVQIRADKKPFKNGPFIFGCAGSFRVLQLLQYVFVTPKHPDRMGLMSYMVGPFTKALRECFNFNGVDPNQVFAGPSAFLTGYQGRLFVVYTDYQIGETHNGFAAVGSGALPALGALEILHKQKMSTPVKLKRALEAASKYVATVRGPFHVQSA